MGDEFWLWSQAGVGEWPCARNARTEESWRIAPEMAGGLRPDVRFLHLFDVFRTLFLRGLGLSTLAIRSGAEWRGLAPAVRFSKVA